MAAGFPDDARPIQEILLVSGGIHVAPRADVHYLYIFYNKFYLLKKDKTI